MHKQRYLCRYILTFGWGYVRLLTHEGMRTCQYLCFAAVATAPPNPWVFGALDGKPQPFRRTCSKLIDTWNVWWKTPPSKIMFQGYVGRISHPMIGWAWCLSFFLLSCFRCLARWPTNSHLPDFPRSIERSFWSLSLGCVKRKWHGCDVPDCLHFLIWLVHLGYLYTVYLPLYVYVYLFLNVLWICIGMWLSMPTKQ